MVTTVFIIGAINLGLGFGLALVCEQLWDSGAKPSWTLPKLAFKKHRFAAWQRFRWPRMRFLSFSGSKSPENASSAAGTNTSSHTPSATIPAVKDQPPQKSEPAPDYSQLPSEWRTRLQDQKVVTRSYWEALLWILSSNLFAKRPVAFALDNSLQVDSSVDRRQELLTWSEEVDTVLLDSQKAIENAPDRGPHGPSMEEFGKWLAAQSAEWKKLQTALTSPMASDPHTANLAAPRETLVAMCHRLSQILAGCHARQTELLRVEKRSQLGSLTQYLANLASFHPARGDLVEQEWLERDAERVRMVSASLFELDAYPAFIEQWGADSADKLGASLFQLLKELVRKDRGFDRVAWVSETQFFVLLGDTALRNATAGTERIRQSVAGTVLRLRGQELHVTMSAAVTEWLPSESLDELLRKLGGGLNEARSAGGNATAVCTDELRLAQSSRMQLPPREIALA